MKEYTYALIYNNPKLKDEWMETHKVNCDKWEYDMKSQKFTTYKTFRCGGDAEESKSIWMLHKYVPEPHDNTNPLRDRYCSVQLFTPVFLDGEFKAQDIMFIMSRIRGGVRDA